MTPLTQLEKIAAGVIAALLLAIAIIIWWNLHDRTEQKIGATACIQSTTETKQTAAAAVATTEEAQHEDIDEVKKRYAQQVQDLSASNADLARRLSTRGAVCTSGVPDPGSAPRGDAANGRLVPSEGHPEASQLERILDAGDANQIKIEDCASIYNKVRDRAIAAEAARKK